MNYNRVMIGGHLTRDPELRFLNTGACVCDFGIATNRSWTGADGNKREEVCFVDVSVWGKQAERCAEFLKKGRAAFVEGRLDFDQWEKDGVKRSKHRVTADRVIFLGAKPGAQQEATPAPQTIDDDVPF